MKERSGQGAPACFDPRDLVRTLVEATSRALCGMDCDDLTATHRTGWFGTSAKVDLDAADRAVHRYATSPERTDEIDAESVAQWIVHQYPGRSYPGVVVGSRHGAAVHLAAALGVPWLPAGFDIGVRWPDGSPADAAAAMSHGLAAALPVLDRNDRVLVRQVHDPVSAGAVAGREVRLHLRWQMLPEAYRSFLSENLAPGAFAILLRDVRGWPVLDGGGRYSFQIGSAVSGLDCDEYLGGPDLREIVVRTGSASPWRSPPGAFGRDCGEFGVEPGIDVDLRRWAFGHGGRVYSVIYAGPEVFSAAVADVYREWLRRNGKTGNRLVVESGRLIDPRQVIRTGMVPYWCENATRAAVTGAELWVAASAPFTSVEVFPEPAGLEWSRLATKEQWSAPARFATRRGVVDPGMARAYPLRPIAPRSATEALRAHPYDLPEPAPLAVEAAIAGLRTHGSTSGLLVSLAARE